MIKFTLRNWGMFFAFASMSTGVFAQTADIAVTNVDTPDPVATGQLLTYTLTLTNNGPSTALNVVLDDVIPTGTTFNTLGFSGTVPGTCTQPAAGATGTVHCTFASFPVTGNAVYSLVVNVLGGTTGPISNTATVTTTTTDPVPANNSVTATTTVLSNADVAVTNADSPDPIATGQLLTYTLTVTNNGPGLATGVVLDDVIPTGTTFNSLGFSGIVPGSCTQPAAGATGTVHCTFASFPVTGDAAYTLRVNVLGGTSSTVSNTATVTTTTTDPVPANNSVTATTTLLSNADVAITNVDSPDPVAAGQLLTYILTVTNNGPGLATGVVLDDVIPTGTTFNTLGFSGDVPGSCTQPAAGATGTVHCTWASFPAAQNAVYSLVVNVLAGTTGTISNTATVTTTTTDPTPANNSATQTTTITAHALDIDGNGSYDALTDGLLVIRHLFGLSGASLISGAVGPGATRITATQIGDYLASIHSALDIDGNGQPDALTDGLLVLRYLFGLRGASLIAGALGPGATRITAPAIETQLQSMMP